MKRQTYTTPTGLSSITNDAPDSTSYSMKTDTITIDKILATIVVLASLFVGYLLGGCVGREIEREKMVKQEAQP